MLATTNPHLSFALSIARRKVIDRDALETIARDSIPVEVVSGWGEYDQWGDYQVIDAREMEMDVTGRRYLRKAEVSLGHGVWADLKLKRVIERNGRDIAVYEVNQI